MRGEAERVHVEVRDTGTGIPETDQTRVFRGASIASTKRAPRALGGTGLGLAIVKHLVQSMGGDIGLESVLGQGSRFYLSLPNSPPPSAGSSESARSPRPS